MVDVFAAWGNLLLYSSPTPSTKAYRMKALGRPARHCGMVRSRPRGTEFQRFAVATVNGAASYLFRNPASDRIATGQSATAFKTAKERKPGWPLPNWVRLANFWLVRFALAATTTARN